MMTTVDEVNSDKKGIGRIYFFVVFCLIALVPNTMSKLIHNRRKLTCKLLLIKTRYRYIRVCKRTIGSLFSCFSPLFSDVQP